MKKMNYKLLIGMISTGVVLTQTNVANAMNNESGISGYKTRYQYGLVEKKTSTPLEVAYRESYRNDYNKYSNRYRSYKKDSKNQNKDYLSLSFASSQVEGKSYKGTNTIDGSTLIDLSGNHEYPKETGNSLRIAYGTYATEKTRFEISYTMSDEVEVVDSYNNLSKTFKTSVDQYMLNLERDIIQTGNFSIFLGAGAGVAKIDSQSIVEAPGVNFENQDEASTNFAWELKAGAVIKTGDKFEVFGNFTYSDLGSQEWTSEGIDGGTHYLIEQESDLVSQKFEIGVRYKF